MSASVRCYSLLTIVWYEYGESSDDSYGESCTDSYGELCGGEWSDALVGAVCG